MDKCSEHGLEIHNCIHRCDFSERDSLKAELAQAHQAMKTWDYGAKEDKATIEHIRAQMGMDQKIYADLFDAHTKLQRKAEALAEALRKMNKQMKLINGTEDECVLIELKECMNHSVIRESDDLLAAFDGKGE